MKCIHREGNVNYAFTVSYRMGLKYFIFRSALASDCLRSIIEINFLCKKGILIMQNVFGYFLSIGAGLAFGFVIVLVPSYLIFNKIQGGKKNV